MSLSGVRGHGRPGAGPGHPEARPRRAKANGRLTVAAVGAALVLAACSSGSAPPSATPSSSLPSSPVATTPSTSPSPVVAKGSLLSGRVGKADGQVLVVKLDNTPPSEPHAGIKSADVVYIEQVEGGLSRYAVVFSTALPPSVGPVRSARISDIELLRQYGKVAFAYSGAQSKMLPVLRSAYLYDVSSDEGGKGYYRVSSRHAPYNLFGDPKVLLRRAPHSAHAVDVGFRFSAATPPGGVPARTVTARYPATRATFTWNAASGRWLAAMNGRRAMAVEGGQLGGTTVIIQYVRVTPSPYIDVNGNDTPMSHSVGTGRALILRDGRAWQATWSRPTATAPTHWLVGGKDFPLAPGQVWVLLMNKTRPATIG